MLYSFYGNHTNNRTISYQNKYHGLVSMKNHIINIGHIGNTVITAVFSILVSLLIAVSFTYHLILGFFNFLS